MDSAEAYVYAVGILFYEDINTIKETIQAKIETLEWSEEERSSKSSSYEIKTTESEDMFGQLTMKKFNT